MRPAEAQRELLPLAFEELGEQDTRELLALKQQVFDAVAFPCASYKEKYLRRRIAVRMRARGVQSYGAYARVLQAEPAEYRRLVDTLTINVSKFFRNHEVWEAVRTSVLPALRGSGASHLRAWSAGCAGGEEPYSMNIMLQEYRDRTPGAPSHEVLGTDIDEAVLELAARAEYTAFALADMTGEARQHWFGAGPPFRLRADARQGVSFRKLDMLRDPLPQDQHLVFCRNVLIYLERAQQEALFGRLHAALAPGGFLVLGKVEALTGSAGKLFATISARQRIFRKHDLPARPR